jgi:hypothetical protein
MCHGRLKVCWLESEVERSGSIPVSQNGVVSFMFGGENKVTPFFCLDGEPK